MRLGTMIGSVAAAIWLASAFMVHTSHAAAKEQDLNVYLDGELSGWTATAKRGVTYLPLSKISELGGHTTESERGKTYVISTRDEQELRFTVGEQTIYINGVPERSEYAAVESDGQIQIPAAWVSEAFGVKWINDPITKSLLLFNRQAGFVASATKDPTVPARLAEKPPAPHLDQVTVSTAIPTLSGIVLADDEVRIATTGSVHPAVFELKEPNRIVIDLPEVQVERDADGSASGSIAVDEHHPIVGNIRYSFFNAEPETVRVVVDLKARKPFVVEQSAENMETSIRFVEAEPISVFIDAGHGGSDPGASSISGRFEKDLTLPIAHKVYNLLSQEKLITPVMVRTNDTYISPADRAVMANAAEADLFISIHANTADSSQVSGTETFYWRDDSAEFAKVIHGYLLEAMGSEDRKVKRERFVVVRETTMPAVLLELGFMTNQDDEAKLYDENKQNEVARAIVAAIKEYHSLP